MNVLTPVAPDVSAVVVNFQSAGYTIGLVESLAADAFEVDGRPGRVEITIVDNASRGDDVARLEAIVRPGVRLVRNTVNAGYALANNQGFHVSRGRWHLVVNPDVRIPAGTMGALIRAAETLPDAGLVGPVASMDAQGRVLLPPNELPDPWREGLTALARCHGAVARYNARLRTRFAHRYWRATRPLDLEMLSGGCFLGRRATILECGLFDGGYPLYYEDTDLFRRFRERGKKLWHVPDARIVHFFSRSAITRLKAAMHRHDVSARRYFARWFGEAGLRVQEAGRKRADASARDGDSPWPLGDVRAGGEPPSIDAGETPGVYVEIAGNPQFTLAAGMFPEGPGTFTIPSGFWRDLGPNQYFVRTVDPNTFDTVRAWRVVKEGA